MMSGEGSLNGWKKSGEKEMEEVKKEVKKRSKNNFYLIVFQRIKAGLNPAQLSKELNVSKQKLKYYTDWLKREGYIRRKGYGTWEILKEVKTFSLGLRVEKPMPNLHALQINFPILEGKIDDKDWIVRNKLRNWLPKYKGLDVLGGLTIRNNNNKSLTIFAKSRDILDLAEVDNLAFKIRAYAYEYFKNKYGVILDVLNCETKNLNLATQDKQSESMIRKGEKFELDLDKKAEKIFNKDKMDAKAWIDGSPFKFSAETNDKEWKRAYLQMPFMMRDITLATHYIAKNYASHVGVMEKLNNLLKVPKVRGHLVNKMKKGHEIQTTLLNFL